MHDFRQRSFAALHMERRAAAERRPQSAALPAGIGIVDAAVEALGVEAHRIGHAQDDELAVDQRDERSLSLPVATGTLSPRPSVLC